ncbi:MULTISPECIES: hypothetical protein [Thalassospira]|uniref:hypothetical protein n=1 Tax=Thalassospira TaxID=168934 RepID=UPI00028722FB|nr:hypothetical protein [Thalassospira profundimaris]EKF06475.1 hypothetical protein TH2_19128 [Thalassospira profundimaris WP0211]
MQNRFWVLLISAVMFSFTAPPARGEEIVRMAFPTGAVEFFKYEFGVIELALEHADGDFRLVIEEFPTMTQARISSMMLEGQVDVMFTGYSVERETKFLQVDFPMTRGLLGYRIFLTQADNLPTLEKVESLEQLKKFCIGTGSDWPDASIMEKNGFCVDRAPRDQLWAMLANKRFDLLSRAVHEGFREIDTIRQQHPDVVLSTSTVLAYPFDLFIYVNRNNERLHRILTQGLLRAYHTGDFMRHFLSNPDLRHALETLQAPNTHILRIENPDMSKKSRDIDPALWENIVQRKYDDDVGYEPRDQM